MIILDSSVWIAYLNKNDSQHKKAEKIFDILNGQQIILLEYLILEIISVLSLRVSKTAADNFIRMILNNKNIELILSSRDLFINSIETFKNIKTHKLSFVDCSLLYLSQSYEIITFDVLLKKEMEKFK